ncbi:hypothetical protein [Saprospira grandis]|uniref:hypothetical protein n=1 Tax=Saprospira grandis TaxID=1008 RepID=UPI0022DD24BD|nr:hypothetical protein [Saprospira grandis]WBM74229.1 hypothetical protein OP864_14670 [Saprospira grandis]
MKKLWLLAMMALLFAPQSWSQNIQPYPGGSEVFSAKKEQPAYLYTLGVRPHRKANFGDGEKDMQQISGSWKGVNHKMPKGVSAEKLQAYYEDQLCQAGYKQFYRCRGEEECGIQMIDYLYTGQDPKNAESLSKLYQGVYGNHVWYSLYTNGKTLAVLMVSAAYPEEFPRVVLETVKANKPVVYQGFPYALENGVGWDLPKQIKARDAYVLKNTDYYYFGAKGKKISLKTAQTSTFYTAEGLKPKYLHYLIDSILVKDRNYKRLYSKHYDDTGFFLEHFEKESAPNAAKAPADYLYDFGSFQCMYSSYEKNGQIVVVAISYYHENDPAVFLVDVLGKTNRGIQALGQGLCQDGSMGQIGQNDAGNDMAAIEPYLGCWESSWGTMCIEFKEGKIQGTYTHDNGRIEGELRNGRFFGTWSESPSYSMPDDGGEVELILSADKKSFTGKWRYGRAGEWREDWTGTKK